MRAKSSHIYEKSNSYKEKIFKKNLMVMDDNIIEIKNLTKKFPGVSALTDVSFYIKRGSIHCIIGENGAGKSTFIKILTGVFKKTSGNIFFEGNDFEPRDIKDAIKNSMSMLYQELNVVDQLTVEQNLSLGKENSRFGLELKAFYDYTAVKVLREIDPGINIKSKLGDLSFAQKQIVEIAKAISTNSKVIIMDEPTAAITEEEVKKLFKIIKDLKSKDVTIIYISHRLDEIFEIGDYVTIFRDGNHIITTPVNKISSKTELIKMMIGKEVHESYIKGNANYKNKLLEVKGLSDEKLKNINFDLYEGEIVGFYGLVGSGKTEIAKAIFGAGDKKGIKVKLNGRQTLIKNSKDAVRKGISLVPEERRAEGLFSLLTVRENITVMDMDKVSTKGILSVKKERILAEKFINMLKIVTPGSEQVVALLSGGNQQKVVISKCLNADSTIILLDEPTRGIDVGAKEEIHNIIRDLTKKGVSIILFSVELFEIASLCDRIFVMFDGVLKAEFKNKPNISDKILHISLGGK